MTANQNQALANQETKRTNLEKERFNFGQLAETSRANREKEAENLRSNQAKEAETKRHNTYEEAIGTANAVANNVKAIGNLLPW